MKDNKENRITIDITLYEDLIITQQNYFKLVKYIFDNCKLSYDKERLMYDKNLDLLKYFCPMQYDIKLEELKKEEEKNV